MFTFQPYSAIVHDDNDDDDSVLLFVYRNVLLLDFNHILPVGLDCVESLAADTHRQRMNKTQFNYYRQAEAEYFSVSYIIIICDILVSSVASPGFVARRGRDGNYVMGHSRWTSGPGAAAARWLIVLWLVQYWSKELWATIVFKLLIILLIYLASRC